jgi:hypothetical protein
MGEIQLKVSDGFGKEAVYRDGLWEAANRAMKRRLDKLTEQAMADAVYTPWKPATIADKLMSEFIILFEAQPELPEIDIDDKDIFY